jgi:endonuclease/exonuclease/phosphatase family metal-dependent hydrolase
MVLLCHVADDNMRSVILSVYKNPRSSSVTFMQDLEKLLQRIPQNIPTFIVGDFNIDLAKPSRSTKDLMSLTRYYGFHQLVDQSTHRRGGILDLLFVNRDLSDRTLDIIPTYYSDHLIVSFAFPIKEIL